MLPQCSFLHLEEATFQNAPCNLTIKKGSLHSFLTYKPTKLKLKVFLMDDLAFLWYHHDIIIGASVETRSWISPSKKNCWKCGNCCEPPYIWFCITHDPLMEDSSYSLCHKEAFYVLIAFVSWKKENLPFNILVVTTG